MLLLPSPVEAMQARVEVEELLRWPGVVALEPGLLPPVGATRFVRGQARRLLSRLPGRPAVLVVWSDAQLALAEELSARTQGSEVWREPGDRPLRDRLPGRGFTPS